MNTVTVTTRKQLEMAVSKGRDEIIVKGDLADKVHRSRGILALGPIAVAVLAAALAVAPGTAGLSLAAVVPLASIVGAPVSLILVLLSLGIILMSDVWRLYMETSYLRSKALILKHRS